MSTDLYTSRYGKATRDSPREESSHFAAFDRLVPVRLYLPQEHQYRTAVTPGIQLCTGPRTPSRTISARPMPGSQNVGRSPTCGHFQDGHMVAEWSDRQ